MEKLERYKKLSTIDKSNLTTYSIYNYKKYIMYFQLFLKKKKVSTDTLRS